MYQYLVKLLEKLCTCLVRVRELLSLVRGDRVVFVSYVFEEVGEVTRFASEGFVFARTIATW